MDYATYHLLGEPETIMILIDFAGTEMWKEKMVD